MELEGVVKFDDSSFQKKQPIDYSEIEKLDFWRKILYENKLIGQNQTRYNGKGYGNVSQRLEPYNTLPNKRKFVITGTQTGNLPILTAAHYTTVLEYYPEKNRIVAEGPLRASSESMTHGKIYDLDETIRYVFHVHSPEIWQNAECFQMPITRKDIEYGTPEMAFEVERLFRESDVLERKIFAMGGHEDGIFSFSATADEAGMILLSYLRKSVS